MLGEFSIIFLNVYIYTVSTVFLKEEMNNIILVIVVLFDL